MREVFNSSIAIFLFQNNICNEGGVDTSRDSKQDELQAASKAMKAAGHLGYEEFCEQLNKTIFIAYSKDADNNLIKSVANKTAKKNLKSSCRSISAT